MRLSLALAVGLATSLPCASAERLVAGRSASAVKLVDSGRSLTRAQADRLQGVLKGQTEGCVQQKLGRPTWTATTEAYDVWGYRIGDGLLHLRVRRGRVEWAYYQEWPRT